MAETHLVSGLKQRRAERLGELEEVRARLSELEAQEQKLLEMLAHVDALLVVEAPDLELARIKPRKPRTSRVPGTGRSEQGAKRIPITKAILRLMRTEQLPMSVDEVVVCLRRDYGDVEERKLVQNVRAFLSTKKTSGVLTASEDGAKTLRYAIAA